MTVNMSELRICLEECGSSDIAEEASELYSSGNYGELTKLLKRKRCDLVEEMHGSQRKVDMLDYLIRQTEKERN